MRQLLSLRNKYKQEAQKIDEGIKSQKKREERGGGMLTGKKKRQRDVEGMSERKKKTDVRKGGVERGIVMLLWHGTVCPGCLWRLCSMWRGRCLAF